MSKEPSGEAQAEYIQYADWRERLEANELLGVRCHSCGHVTATPKRVCPDCGSRQLEGVELPTTGTVYSETTINVPPEGFEGSYKIAVVDLGEAGLLARTDKECEIGDTVEFTGFIVEDDLPAPVFESTD
jgi:uncharacterized OB-fold protein